VYLSLRRSLSSSYAQSNGEKASPGPIETVLRSSPHISDALVIGSDKPQLGLLLFPRSGSPIQLLDIFSPLLTQANQSSPSFAQISLEMCKVITDTDKVLPKSSKGTVQRGMAYEAFKNEIEELYNGRTEKVIGKKSLVEIEEVVRDIVLSISGMKGELTRDTDLFSWGVNSLMATRIRAGILKVNIIRFL
jgi:acyl-CoA synthetase (AMP-forming)/AMP-acid ligase II